MTEYRTESADNNDEAVKFKDNCIASQAVVRNGISAIVTNFKILSQVFNYFNSGIHSANVEKARDLLDKHWFKMSEETLVKKLWSEGEIVAWLNSHGDLSTIKKISEQCGLILQKLEKIQKYFDTIKGIVELGAAIGFNYSEGVYTITANTEGLSSCAQIREDARNAAECFKLAIKAIEVINTLVPKGMKEYLSFNIEALKQAQKVFSIADEYADLIIKLAEETDSLYRAFNKPTSHGAASFFLAERDMDMDMYFDYIAAQEKRQKINQAEIQRQLNLRPASQTIQKKKKSYWP